MKWGTLGRSKDVEPLLVRLYDNHRMYQLAGDQKPEARSELSHIVSGLLTMDLKPTEKELIADILINLMRQAERDLRHALAERLSVLEDVPLRLILFMAQDEIGVAESVLRSSPVLNDLDLLYIIQSHDAEYWRAIATRKNLNEPVIDALADTRDVDTACVLAENPGVHFSPFAMEIMGEMATIWKDVARPLLTRSDIPEELSRKLYTAIGAEMEKTINATLQNELSVLESVKDILQEFSVENKDAFEPTQAMIKAADMFAAKGQLTSDLMIKTLKRGQISSFVAQISCLSKIRVPKMLEILRQKEGKTLAVTLKALYLAREDFVAVYLLTHKMRQSGNQTGEKINTVEFNAAVKFFDTLPHPAAQKIFGQYLN